MMKRLLFALLLPMWTAFAAMPAHAQTSDGPAPPKNLTARDGKWGGGDRLVLEWEHSPDAPDNIAGYRVYRSMNEAEIAREDADTKARAIRDAVNAATKAVREELEAASIDENSPEGRARLREARLEAARQAAEAADMEIKARAGEKRFMFVDLTLPSESTYTVDKLSRTEAYLFRVDAVDEDGNASVAIETEIPMTPVMWPFDGTRVFLGVIVVVLCGAVMTFIALARRGISLKVRKIAGLDAVDEAVGRATEMGRPVLFVPGIQDVNDIQTIAGITILSRVAKTAAEYDARVEVPTSRSLVMTAARETVQASFLEAGRPDAYNQDLIYYVTDEQFGYVAYLSGMMVREKPAACFYLGSFFAESLILAETGNSIGAIQIAGTAQPAQLPFFVAACDYTLIGEEFFAASAYLSGSPEELGSLKGQDVGKLIVAAGMLIGVGLATAAAITGLEQLGAVVDFIRDTMLA